MAAKINWPSYVTLYDRERENVTTVTAHGRLKLLLEWGVEAPTFVLTNEYKRICLPWRMIKHLLVLSTIL